MLSYRINSSGSDCARARRRLTLLRCSRSSKPSIGGSACQIWESVGLRLLLRSAAGEVALEVTLAEPGRDCLLFDDGYPAHGEGGPDASRDDGLPILCTLSPPNPLPNLSLLMSWADFEVFMSGDCLNSLVFVSTSVSSH